MRLPPPAITRWGIFALNVRNMRRKRESKEPGETKKTLGQNRERSPSVPRVVHTHHGVTYRNTYCVIAQANYMAWSAPNPRRWISVTLAFSGLQRSPSAYLQSLRYFPKSQADYITEGAC